MFFPEIEKPDRAKSGAGAWPAITRFGRRAVNSSPLRNSCRRLKADSVFPAVPSWYWRVCVRTRSSLLDLSHVCHFTQRWSAGLRSLAPPGLDSRAFRSTGLAEN